MRLQRGGKNVRSLNRGIDSPLVAVHLVVIDDCIVVQQLWQS